LQLAKTAVSWIQICEEKLPVARYIIIGAGAVGGRFQDVVILANRETKIVFHHCVHHP